MRRACEEVVEAQQALVDALCWQERTDPEVPEVRLFVPALDFQELAASPSLSPDASLLLRHLQARNDELAARLAEEGVARRVPDGFEIHLRRTAGGIPVPAPIEDAWRRTKVAAITLVETYGSPAQRERLHEARRRIPVGEHILVVSHPRTGAERGEGAVGRFLSTLGFRRAEPAPGRLGTVLLVDDEPDILESLAAYLSTKVPGVRVLTAASGDEALEVLPKEEVTLIVSDLRMPRMDGITFLEKAKDVSPGARRVLLTAYPGPEVDARAEQAHVQGVLRKPAALDELVGIVQAMADRPKA